MTSVHSKFVENSTQIIQQSKIKGLLMGLKIALFGDSLFLVPAFSFVLSQLTYRIGSKKVALMCQSRHCPIVHNRSTIVPLSLEFLIANST